MSKPEKHEMTDFHWNDANIAILKERHADGESAASIGAAIGCSRNAAIGKIHRLGLVPPTIRKIAHKPNITVTLKPPNQKSVAMPKISLEPSAYINATELSALDGKGVTLEDLTADGCHWPHGQPSHPSFRYCGHMALEGQPYCAKHFAISLRAN
jgi:GcrA cell cycle regulator